MTDSRATRCPHCQTIFRVTAAQLDAREGRVRCGRCRRVFDASHSLLPPGATALGSPAAPSPTPGVAAPQASALVVTTGALAASASAELAGPGSGDQRAPEATDGESRTRGATVFASDPSRGEPAAELEAQPANEEDRSPSGPSVAAASRDGTALQVRADAIAAGDAHPGKTGHDDDRPTADRPIASPGEEDGDGDRHAGDESAVVQAPVAAAGSPPAAGTPVGAAASDVASELAGHRSWEQQDDARRWIWATLVPLLALFLAAQAAYQLRHLLAARLPAVKPALVTACGWIGCRVEPPRARDRLSIEASELQADPAHRGLLVLTATVRNRADMAVAYPHLELTLTDLQQQTVARRAFIPGEYAGGTAQVEAGIPARGEVTLKLFIDASATEQQGYRLYLFYP